MTIAKPFQLGTVISGTLKPEDLLPALHKVFSALHHYRWGVQRGTPQEQVDELQEVLNEMSPPFVYFGAHPGDGADFGFWPDWAAIDEVKATHHSAFSAGHEFILDACILWTGYGTDVAVFDRNRNLLWGTV